MARTIYLPSYQKTGYDRYDAVVFQSVHTRHGVSNLDVHTKRSGFNTPSTAIEWAANEAARLQAAEDENADDHRRHPLRAPIEDAIRASPVAKNVTSASDLTTDILHALISRDLI